MSATAEIESRAEGDAIAKRSLASVARVQSRDGGGVWWESGSGPMKQYTVRQRRVREGQVVQEFDITDWEQKKPPLQVLSLPLACLSLTSSLPLACLKLASSLPLTSIQSPKHRPQSESESCARMKQF